MYNLTVFAIFRSITGCQALVLSLKEQRGVDQEEDTTTGMEHARRQDKRAATESPYGKIFVLSTWLSLNVRPWTRSITP